MISRLEIPTSGRFSKNTALKLAQLHAPGVVSGKASGSRVTGQVVQFFDGKPNKCYTETFTASLG